MRLCEIAACSGLDANEGRVAVDATLKAARAPDGRSEKDMANDGVAISRGYFRKDN